MLLIANSAPVLSKPINFDMRATIVPSWPNTCVSPNACVTVHCLPGHEFSFNRNFADMSGYNGVDFAGSERLVVVCCSCRTTKARPERRFIMMMGPDFSLEPFDKF